MNQFATIYQVFDAIPREIDFLIDRLGSSSLKLFGKRTRDHAIPLRTKPTPKCGTLSCKLSQDHQEEAMSQLNRMIFDTSFPK